MYNGFGTWYTQSNLRLDSKILKIVELPLVGLQLALELANETRNQIPIKIVCITPEIRNIVHYVD